MFFRFSKSQCEDDKKSMQTIRQPSAKQRVKHNSSIFTVKFSWFPLISDKNCTFFAAKELPFHLISNITRLKTWL